MGVEYSERLKGRRYCTLIFLENVERVVPFKVSKVGYPIASGWMAVKDINKVRLD